MKFLSKIGIWKLGLIVVAGVLLIGLSAKDFVDMGKDEQIVSTNTGDDVSDEDSNRYIRIMENRLKSVLSKVDGVGDANVMITLESSSEKVTLKDIPRSSEITNETSENGTVKQQTNSRSEESTIYSEEGKGKVPYVVKEIEPQILGVVVVSKGGDNPAVKKEIIEAVQVLFGIEAHKIKVMKHQ